MKKHLFTLTLSSVLAIPAVSHAEFKGGFADIGIHYLDWTSRTTEKSSTKSHKDDFGYLELLLLPCAWILATMAAAVRVLLTTR